MASNVSVFIYPLIPLAMLALMPLMRKGGHPVRRNGETVYPTRPGMKVTFAFVMLMGLGICAFPGARHSLAAFTVFGPLGFCFLVMGLFGVSARYSIDGTGLHYRRVGRTTTIEWHELDHYETQVNSRVGAEQIFFRSSTGASIEIQDIVIDSAAFLSHVKVTRQLRHQPYKRQHWWGG